MGSLFSTPDTPPPPPPPANPATMADPRAAGGKLMNRMRSREAQGAGAAGMIQSSAQGAAPAPTANKTLLGQ